MKKFQEYCEMQEDATVDPVTLIRRANTAISLAADNLPMHPTDVSVWIGMLKKSLDRLEAVAQNPQYGAYGDAAPK